MNKIIQRLDSIRDKLLAAVVPLDAIRFRNRPTENEWGAADILHHLCLVERQVITDLQRALAADPQKVGLLGRIIPTSIVASRLIKVKAPKAVVPTNPPDKELALENLQSARNRLKQLCVEHGEKNLRKVVLNHPFFGKIDGTAAISMVGYHELRHYKQLRAVLKRV